MKKIYLSLICCLFINAFCLSQTHYPQNFAVREGFVSQLLRSNDTLFGVGQFSMSGYRLGAIIRYKGDIPFLESGVVSDVEPDGNGGWYIALRSGGMVAGKQRSGVLHFNNNLELDTNFVLMGDQSTSNKIFTLKLHNGVLYAGGNFVPSGVNLNRPFLVAYNVSTNAIITGFNPGFADGAQSV